MKKEDRKNEWKMNALLSTGRPTLAEAVAYALYLASGMVPVRKSVLLEMDSTKPVDAGASQFFGKSVFAKSSAQVATSVAPQVVQPESGELKLNGESDGRRHPLGVRFTDEELVLVKAKAKAAECSTNGYIRAAALGSDYKPPRDPEQIRLLAAATRQLTAWGNNLNQIAHKRNSNLINEAETNSMLGIIARPLLQALKAVRAALSYGKEHPEP